MFENSIENYLKKISNEIIIKQTKTKAGVGRSPNPPEHMEYYVTIHSALPRKTNNNKYKFKRGKKIIAANFLGEI